MNLGHKMSLSDSCISNAKSLPKFVQSSSEDNISWRSCLLHETESLHANNPLKQPNCFFIQILLQKLKRFFSKNTVK